MRLPPGLTKFAKDLVTVANGNDYDVGRVLWVAGTLVFFGLAIYTVGFKGAAFSYTEYGMGLGAVLAGGGAALNLKHKTEPQDGENPVEHHDDDDRKV